MYESRVVATSTLQITETYHKLVVRTEDPGVTPQHKKYNLGNSPDRARKIVMAEQDPGGQPPDRPPAYNGPFLFVNKNATNLRSRQREEVFAVRSHAMQIARRSRKPSSQSKSQERAAQAPSDQQAEAPSTRRVSESPSAEPGQSMQENAEQQAMGARQHQQRQSQKGDTTHSRRQSLSHRRPGSSPPNRINLGPSLSPSAMPRLLPVEHAAALSQLTISASPTGMTPTALDLSAGALPPDFFNSVLQFWKLAYMSNFWPAHIYLSPSHQAVQFTDGWIRGMVINNPALLHGLFAGALSYITNYLPPTDNTPMLWARANHHYGKCLEETRTQMARPGISAEQSLSLIHGMTTFSFHCQDLESCQVHRTASMRLLDGLEGGLESIHPVLKYLLVLCDALTASHVPKRPSMDVEAWAPKPWPEEDSLRSLDGIFTFEEGACRQTDTIAFLLDHDVVTNDYAEDLLDLVDWHREALAANDLAFTLTPASPEGSPGALGSVSRPGRDRADPVYAWLSLRQYGLSCLCSHMFMDLLEIEDHGLSLLSQLSRTYHCCVLLATSFLFQFVMRREMDAPCMAYIPYQHLRTQLDSLLTLMSQYRRSSTAPATPGSTGRGAVNPIPTDGLLFLFFAGALGETSDRSSRVRVGMSAATAAQEHPGDFIHERWFSVHFAMVLQRLNIDAWEDAQRVLKRFVYAERVLDGVLQALVARKLEFLAALVAGVPPVDPPSMGHAFFGGARQPDAVMRAAGSPSRPPGPSRRTSLQMAPSPLAHPLQASMLSSIPITSAAAMPALNAGLVLDTLPLFGPTPVSLSAAVPGAGADWWQDMGYDLGGEDQFSMDLDAQLNMGAGLDMGQGFDEHEGPDEE